LVLLVARTKFATLGIFLTDLAQHGRSAPIRAAGHRRGVFALTPERQRTRGACGLLSVVLRGRAQGTRKQ